MGADLSMSYASDVKYMQSISNKIILAMDSIVQQVALESITWLAIMTVQDSGNAAGQWDLLIGDDAGSVSFENEEEIGRGEKRRPRGAISSSDTFSSLGSTAKKSVITSIGGLGIEVTRIVMEDGKYPKVSLDNPISGDSRYDSNAYFVLGKGKEVELIGLERGEAKALTKKAVKNVTG